MANEKQSNSRPYVVQEIPLQSFHAQQIFRRGFDVYTQSIYSLSVVLRAIADENQVREMEGLIDDKLNKAQDDIRNEMARLEKVAENNGITLEKVNYSQPTAVEAKISSHRSARYANIIREFDALIAKLDALWLSGMIPDNEYSRILYEWKRRIIKMASHTSGIVRQAMISAGKKTRRENSDDDASNKAIDQAVSDVEPANLDEPGTNEISAVKSEMTKNNSGLFGWI